MGKDNINSIFDFDNDPEFNENFYKNIEMALGNSDSITEELPQDDGIKAEEKTDNYEVTIESAKSIAENAKDAMEESAISRVSVEDISLEDMDDKLMDINAALAKQICVEMDVMGNELIKKEQKKRRLVKIRNGAIISLLSLIVVVLFFGFTKPGNQLLMGMGVDLSSKIWAVWTDNFDETTDMAPDTDFLDADDLNSDAQEIDPKQIVWKDHPGNGRKEEGVYNILLMGEEAIGSGSGRGRTDVIVVATLNTTNKTIRLTSLMRDMLVQIPGYQDNKLNTAYEKGGLDLMYETIALNFDLRLDGCVMVNFENFEKIIDRLGGLEITLTSGEAKYLNSTNYISKPQYRNVYAGTQLLNGNQVLGYSRVRKRATITGNNNDYGRTDRHRIVLNAVFEKYKTESKVELASIMLGVLPMITTDIDSKAFELLLNSFIEMGTMEMSQLRIPAEGTFTDNVKVRGMDVLIPDLEANVEVLHSFIFGDEAVKNTIKTATTGDEENSKVAGLSNSIEN